MKTITLAIHSTGTDTIALNDGAKRAGFRFVVSESVRHLLRDTVMHGRAGAVISLSDFSDSAVALTRVLNRECGLPVVILGDPNDPLASAALRAGATDVVPQDASVREITVRILAAMQPAQSVQTIRTGNLAFDSLNNRLWVSDVEVHLTPTEAAILRILALRLGEVVDDRSLLEEVWGFEYIDAVEYLRVYTSYLRSKIDRGRDTSYIQRTWGRGYRLVREAVT